MSRFDARLREMQFLAWLDREGAAIRGPYDKGPERQMIITLIQDGYVNGIEEVGPLSPSSWHELLQRYQWIIGMHIGELQQGKPLKLSISHKGRVRLSELEQQLKTGRDRDPTGLCLARRHLMTDLAIAVLSASKEAPLSVAFLDMNGLKAINDTHGHRAGDEAIRAYLEAVVVTFGERGEAYRGEGGDEVVVILPNESNEQAQKLLDGFVRQLGKEVLVLGEAKERATLTASCGSVSTTNPAEDAAALLDRADKVQYRSKQESKKNAPRVSAYVVGEGEVITYAPLTS